MLEMAQAAPMHFKWTKRVEGNLFYSALPEWRRNGNFTVFCKNWSSDFFFFCSPPMGAQE